MASVKLILYKSKTLSNGEHPIVLRVIKDRKTKYISLGFSALEKNWTGKELTKGHTHFKKINPIILSKKFELEDIILDFEREKKDYSLEELERVFLDKVLETTVFSYCQDVINRLYETDKIGNSYVYKDLLRSLKKYRNEKDLQFSDIDYVFLVKYEEFNLKNGVSENSISVYMRTLRALINRAIKEGYAKQKYYPFDKYKISKLNTQTKKRAISKEEVMKIIDFPTESGTSLWHSKNYFLFSFFSVGMNLHDMALLRWSDIINNRIKYKRAKTGRFYDIKVQPRLQEILDFYDRGNVNTYEYIFPILNDKIHKTTSSIKERVKKVTKRVSKDLKMIAEAVGIKATHSITHYVARHTWASIQKKNGTTISKIKESMGHDSEKTTEIYLQSFINEELDEVNANLI